MKGVNEMKSIMLVGFTLLVGCGRHEDDADVGGCGSATGAEADTGFVEVHEEIYLTCEDLQEIDQVIIAEGSSYDWTGHIDVDGTPWEATCDSALGEQDWDTCDRVSVGDSSVFISVRCPGGEDDADMHVRIRWWGEN